MKKLSFLWLVGVWALASSVGWSGSPVDNVRQFEGSINYLAEAQRGCATKEGCQLLMVGNWSDVTQAFDPLGCTHPSTYYLATATTNPHVPSIVVLNKVLMNAKSEMIWPTICGPNSAAVDCRSNVCSLVPVTPGNNTGP